MREEKWRRARQRPQSFRVKADVQRMKKRGKRGREMERRERRHGGGGDQRDVKHISESL